MTEYPRVRIKDGWGDAGRTGIMLYCAENKRLGQPWAMVIWDDEDDPDCHKMAGLELITGSPEEKGV